MTAWPMAGQKPEGLVQPRISADGLSMHSVGEAEAALAILDLLASRPQGTPAAVIIAHLGQAGMSAAGTALLVERLFADRQVAAYGDIVCLPDQVARLRQNWLLSATLARTPQKRKRDQGVALLEAEALQRFCKWTGWNMPIGFTG